jgi:hypothetical protein
MNMKQILSVGGLLVALFLTFAPFVAGGDFGINVPMLANPNGMTTLPSGIVLHTSWTTLGQVCMVLGTFASFVMALATMSTFAKD